MIRFLLCFRTVHAVRFVNSTGYLPEGTTAGDRSCSLLHFKIIMVRPFHENRDLVKKNIFYARKRENVLAKIFNLSSKSIFKRFWDWMKVNLLSGHDLASTLLWDEEPRINPENVEFETNENTR